MSKKKMVENYHLLEVVGEVDSKCTLTVYHCRLNY